MGAYSQADDAAGQRVRQAAELAAAAVQQLSPARAAGRAGARRLQGNGGRDRRAEQSERGAEQQQQGRAQRPPPHPRHPSLLSYCFPQPPSFSLWEFLSLSLLHPLKHGFPTVQTTDSGHQISCSQEKWKIIGETRLGGKLVSPELLINPSQLSICRSYGHDHVRRLPVRTNPPLGSSLLPLHGSAPSPTHSLHHWAPLIPTWPSRQVHAGISSCSVGRACPWCVPPGLQFPGRIARPCMYAKGSCYEGCQYLGEGCACNLWLPLP